MSFEHEYFFTNRLINNFVVKFYTFIKTFYNAFTNTLQKNYCKIYMFLQVTNLKPSFFKTHFTTKLQFFTTQFTRPLQKNQGIYIESIMRIV